MARRKLGLCRGCNETKPITAKQLCQGCYYTQPEVIAKKAAYRLQPEYIARAAARQQEPASRIKQKAIREDPQRIAMIKEYGIEYRLSNTAFINAAKDKPCMDCHNSFPVVCMDFDHRPDTVKKFNVSQMTMMSKAAIQAEIAKCDVVCSNCHRIRTHERRAALGESVDNC